MKLALPTLFGAACLAAGFVSALSPASARPVTGELDFTGVATTDTGKLNTAHAFTALSGLSTTSASGDLFYAGGVGPNVGGAAFMSPFSFNPTGSASVSSLWLVDSFGEFYEFDLTKVLSSVYNPSTMGLTIKGRGMVDITFDGDGIDLGYDPTPAIFTLTALANAGGAGGYTFTSSTTAIVPDGGSTVALLGLGLAALEGTRRAFKAKRAGRKGQDLRPSPGA